MNNILLIVITIFIMQLFLTSCTNSTQSNTPQNMLTKDKREENFTHEFQSKYNEELFLLLGDTKTDLRKFKSVTFYVGTKDNIKELDMIFRDYAKRIGSEHVAIFLEYGTQNYGELLDEMKCFHLSPFEVPSIIYVDRIKMKCYYFSHSSGIFLADALQRLSKILKGSSDAHTEKIRFDIETSVDDLVTAFPQLKPLRDLILRISQHIFLVD